MLRKLLLLGICLAVGVAHVVPTTPAVSLSKIPQSKIVMVRQHTPRWRRTVRTTPLRTVKTVRDCAVLHWWRCYAEEGSQEQGVKLTGACACKVPEGSPVLESGVYGEGRLQYPR